MLPSLISLRHPPSTVLQPEDIFSSSLGSIFTDDLRNQHGDDPSTLIVYKSKRYGELELSVADPGSEESRLKFAHYLWNAGVLMGELVGGRGVQAAREDEAEGTDIGAFAGEGGEEQEWKNGEWWVGEEEIQRWSVKGETVLELGAGVGLAGIVSVLAGAEEVVISDYPAPELISNISRNVSKNVPDRLRSSISVQGHEWGDLSSPFSQQNERRFARILAADCLWMPHEHHNLARSMLHFLSASPDARVFVIAGFHTGRAKLAPFFEEVVAEEGLEVEQIFEMDANGKRRNWQAERDGGREDHTGRKKWLVVARLRRQQLP